MGEPIRNVDREVVSPAIEYPVYGLHPWDGPRWLESVDGAARWAVWLGHGSPDGRVGVAVGTLPRATFDAEYPPVAVDRVTAAGLLAAGRFMNLTNPGPPGTRRGGLGEAIRQHIESAVFTHDQWARVPWHIGGHSTGAAVWWFAGAWLAICEAQLDAHVVAIGAGVDPAGLSLQHMSCFEYGVDFGKPVTFADIRNRVATMPAPNAGGLHPDHEALTNRQ